MAWLEHDHLSHHFKLAFRFGGRKFKKSLKTSDHREAQSMLGRAEETLRLLERGRLEVPNGADIATFVLSDGKLQTTPKAPAVLTLGDLFTEYRKHLPAMPIEANSAYTIRIHLNHVDRVLGSRTRVHDLTLVHLQDYVDARARKKGRRGTLSPMTIKKEIATLSGVWAWASLRGLVHGPFPAKGLRYPKTTEKPPFQTFAEILAQIDRGGLTTDEEAALWDGLYLTLKDTEDLLAYFEKHASQPFLYTMVVFAAHTGARRSEMLRSRVGDFDFASNSVTIREKKRARGKRTTRRVPLSPLLRDVMLRWISSNPGGPYTLLSPSTQGQVETGPAPLSVHEAHRHLRRAISGSPWAKLRGWHVFRHSFASNCAAKGLDQRIIDEWMGHQTEEMRKRYRHLFPDQQQQALASVFGGERQ